MTGSRPNILFFQVDQLSARFLRCYGDRVSHTPNLDALAARGVVWDTAYCNYPLCSPSRASMAAGRLASKIGAYDNAAEFPAATPTYAHHLRKAGYDTALSGKMHFIGPDQHHGFQHRLTPDLYPADFAWAPNWGNEGKRDTNDARSVTVSGVCARSVQIDFDEEVTLAAERYLYDRAGEAQPFFLQVSYTHPHEPYLCQRAFWDLYEGTDIPAPDVPPLGDGHDAHAERLMRDFGMWDVTFDPADVQRARRAYFGAVSYVDALIGRVLTALDAVGFGENTAIVFTSDHGDYLGERGMWFKKHFHEACLAVPMIVAAPGLAPGRRAQPVSLVDLVPTFAALAGADLDGTPCDGADMLALEQDRPIYAEYLAEATTAPIVMIREGRWKYIHSADDPPLLYDLEADPQEVSNQAEARPDLVAAFAAKVAERWDLASLSHAIRASQKERLTVRAALAQGEAPRWNHGERAGQPVRWYRGQGSYNDWAFAHVPDPQGQS